MTPSPESTNAAPRLGTRPEVAHYLRISKRTLAGMAMDGTGPRFVVVGRRALYDWADVTAWLQTQPTRRRSAA